MNIFLFILSVLMKRSMAYINYHGTKKAQRTIKIQITIQEVLGFLQIAQRKLVMEQKISFTKW